MMIIFIILIVIVLIFLAILFNNPNIGTNNQNLQEKYNYKQNFNYSQSYERKYSLLSTNELKFYKLLKKIADEMNFSLFTQVSLYQIVKSKNQTAFNRIRSKSIDFVLTDNNSNIKVCIELDDITHKRNDRIQRDKFINELFNELNITLLRIPVQNFYDFEDLKCKIKESIL